MTLAAAARVELAPTRLQDEHSEPIELRRNFGGCGWSRTTNLALMRRLLFPVELHSRLLWKPAEELNLVPFRPALEVRFRRPMPGTRAVCATD